MARLVDVLCPSCKQMKPRDVGHVNRSIKIGATVYCGRDCAGIGRRKEAPKSPRNPNWKQLKADYDREFRVKNRERLRAEKAARYKVWGPLNREKEKAKRAEGMQRHIEYCRSPQYREWKRNYDHKFLAKKQWGEFAEAALLLRNIETEIDNRMSWADRKQANGLLNKHKQRRKDYDRITNQPAR